MTDEKTANPTVLLMYVGRCILSDGKSEGRIYYELTESDYRAGVITTRDGDTIERVFSKKSAKWMRGSPGIVYAVEYPADDPTKIYPSTARYVGLWEDRAQRIAWQLADSVIRQQYLLKQQEKKAQKDDAVLECLAPIRAAYQQASGVQRNLVLARVVQYLTR